MLLAPTVSYRRIIITFNNNYYGFRGTAGVKFNSNWIVYSNYSLVWLLGLPEVLISILTEVSSF